ncbi:MAG: hypothetical protein PSV35_09380 [bacterium]|nr:hypothetical protein [bacterium]
MLDYMKKDFYKNGFIKTSENHMDRGYISRLDYRLDLLRKAQGTVYKRLSMPFQLRAF